jgi:putative ABC transport system permease protein
VNADLDARYPVAASLHTDGGPIGDGTVRAMTGLPALSVVALVGTAPATFPDGGKPTPTRIASLPPALANRLIPSDSAAEPVLLLPAAYLRARGLADGSSITVQVSGHAVRFTARASRLADTTGELLGVASASALATTGIRTVPTAVWGVAPPGFDRSALANDVNAVAAKDAGVEVGGGITEGSDIMNVLSILLGLSLGMLAVTVVIALLGIANLLGLSVIERTREMALLRALGIRRGRLRSMIAIEAVVITLMGTLAGIVIGAPVGLAGVIAAVGHQAEPVVRMPWSMLGVLLIAAAVTGVLASLPPARRATRIAPAEGLTR